MENNNYAHLAPFFIRNPFRWLFYMGIIFIK